MDRLWAKLVEMDRLWDNLGKMGHLHNPKPRYNADDPKKGGSNLSLFKGNLAPASVSNPVSLDNEQWRTISLYIFNNLIEVRPYIE